MHTDGVAVPYALRIGVTGHRKLADAEGVARAVRRVLVEIVKTLDVSRGVPLTWTVVSPLARGADRVVASAVLELPAARLSVITPLPVVEYQRDFQDQRDLAEFQMLLARASSVYELTGPGRVPHQPSDKERDLAYLRVGKRVVDACEILICVWDGESAAGLGGTADVVEYARRQGRTIIRIDPSNLDDLVFPDTAKALSPGYSQQKAFFSDQAVAASSLADAVRSDASALRMTARNIGLSEGTLDPTLSTFLPVYVRADRLAIHYQRLYVRATNAVLYLAAAAVTVAAAQIMFLPEHPQLALLEVFSMMAVFAVWWCSQRRAWRPKWLHDRCLAEQLRNAMFMSLLGETAGHTSDDRLPFYPGPHQWLDSVVQTLIERASPLRQDVPLEALRQFVSVAWLKEQETFHAYNALKKRHLEERRHRLGSALFGATLLMATLHSLGVGHQGHIGESPVLSIASWIAFFALAIPAWAASVHAITSQLELKRIAARSSRMADMLRGLGHRAEESLSIDELYGVSLEAAMLMGGETREWWALLSFQDVDLHA